MKVLTVFGTRPEAIKMCPLVKALEASPHVEHVLCVTGQHRAMLDQVLEIFEVVPDYDLKIMQERQTINMITTAVLVAIKEVLDKESPDLVLVHGDTTTSMSAALAAFYNQIPVGHVEAGLRTYNIYSPFPEEMNRKLLSALTTYHFAPTENNRLALSRESITERVYVTGNTVIDAFAYTIRDNYSFRDEVLAKHDFSKPTILMTAHRRENLGRPLKNICEAVRELCQMYPELRFIYPVHLNPAVRETVFGILGELDQVSLIDPIDILDMHNAINRSKLVLTDSGGLQEEVPHLGKPVLVLRDTTERPEAIEAGVALLTGTDKARIIADVDSLLNDLATYSKMCNAINPYGDGHASERIVTLIESDFREIPAPFSPKTHA